MTVKQRRSKTAMIKFWKKRGYYYRHKSWWKRHQWTIQWPATIEFNGLILGVV